MRKKFHINPDTLALEQVEQGFKSWLRRDGWVLLGGIVLGIVLMYIFLLFFPSPREKQLTHANQSLRSEYEAMDERVDQMQRVLNDMQQRDDNLYRVLLGAEPIPLSVRQGAQQRIQFYQELSSMSNFALAGDLALKVDVMEKELYTQAKSFDEILDLAKNQEVRMENLPAIQPVLNKDLKRVASGFGIRIDPVYHVRKFHHGMDFTAPVGTEVFATGNATVEFVGWKQGYGNTVVLNHGFGYTTLYAHLYKALVRKGQRVKRSDIIALVGNTGKSTGPHLHYEVQLNRQPVDPRNFYFYDLSPEQYDEMIQLSNNFGQMLD